ncbi:zinc finger protein 346 isoform X2 [Diachasma alloeum]|uniref:zinc finger protein 346 isoform X1 n=1 Tax=Diachasma alloeum TaxID=454923 RepID=UPI0007381716|nr:zinc finger protein 346 isoform X1 [Diachasma alloeum]XP_015112538.1 zinc finger protein 346 isoform X2 [Diachasma alloeum]
MAAPPEGVIDPPLNDPVTKAVVDNIMGNLPTKKPLVRCNDCDLCFTSQTVLDAHLQGARHAKQIRSKVIMATLEETKVAFTKDQEANGLKCNVCNVCLNSIQQLQTHLNGNRHKKKVMKGAWTGTDEDEVKETAAPEPVPAPTSTKGGLLSCEACNKFFNSKAQYDVHIASKKHTQKMSRSGPLKAKRRRFTPYKRKIKPNRNGAAQMHLSNSFVSGGYVYN